MNPPPWHEGERFLQEKAGVVERMAEVGSRVIRDYMPEQHRDFYAKLPFVVLGSVDARGDAWATFVEGLPGFLSSPSPTMLDIAVSKNGIDPAREGFAEGSPVGLLGIEMHTRRRNRLNGTVSLIEGGFRVTAGQSFGNCPRYIQLRDFTFSRDPGQPVAGAMEELRDVDDPARSMIGRADTFFVATYAERDGARQVDVSHRGGNAGFVRVGDDGTLTIPDFAGNLFFSTLGNIVVNGKAGLLFVDFTTGDLLQMTGDAAVILDSPEIQAFKGAERLWTFKPRRIVRRADALALRWSMPEDGRSPNAVMTGNWVEATGRPGADPARQWRPLTVTRIVEESETIRSLHLQPADGAGLLPHEAGQHLPIRVMPSGSQRPLVRSYSLSVAPSDGVYRISVKRDGPVSQFLHDSVAIGDVIEARPPSGTFTIDARKARPAVLLAGGVGITPLLAMLRHVVHEGLARQRIRPVTLFYAARSKAQRAFEKEIRDLVHAARSMVKVVRVLSNTAGAETGIDYDAAGRIDMALLTRHLPFNDHDFYLCGPPQFIQELHDGLRGYGIAGERIFAEAFGPSSLKRSSDAAVTVPARAPPSTRPVPVMFTNAQTQARWVPGSGTLLELAEDHGLKPASSCRAGNCGTCSTKLIRGVVTYVKEPAATVEDREILLCCAVPEDQGEGAIELGL